MLVGAAGIDATGSEMCSMMSQVKRHLNLNHEFIVVLFLCCLSRRHDSSININVRISLLPMFGIVI